jgi:hypothetical protein
MADEERCGLHQRLAERIGEGQEELSIPLGLLQGPSELLVVAIGVVILTVIGWTINRMAGIPMSFWSARDRALVRAPPVKTFWLTV